LEDTKMLLPGLKSVASFFVAAIFVLPAFADNPTPPMPPTIGPGLLNYVEGQVSVNTELIDPESMPPPQLHPGDSLTTEQGKAELLLTPGVFLRVGDNSSVKMISPGLANTVVELDKGHAIVEVDNIFKQNDIRVIEGAANVRLLKTGLYDFDLRQNQLRVFDGKAKVEIAGHEIAVKREHDLDFTNPSALKSQKFDQLAYENDDLYRWSSLRSAYLAEANVDMGAMYAANAGAGWDGGAWYWDPWFDAYTFVPGDGIFYSPFGWGFYAPWLCFEAPFFGGFGYGHHHHFSEDARNWGVRSPYLSSANYSHGIYHGPGSTGSGFHSGPQQADGFRNAGFSSGSHGGGGGFHGGGGGFSGGGGGFEGGGFGGGGFGGGGFGGGGHR
jgi:hypothetical protein